MEWDSLQKARSRSDDSRIEKGEKAFSNVITIQVKVAAGPVSALLVPKMCDVFTIPGLCFLSCKIRVLPL